MKQALKRWIRALGRFPPLAAFLQVRWVRSCVGRLPGAHLLYATGWERRHPFDVAHGIDTSGTVPVAHLQLGADASGHAVLYAGSQPSIVRRALATLPLPLESFCFVDLGCGKGRALVVASEFPFRDIVGVELSEALVATACANAAVVARRFPQRCGIRVVTRDASAFELPAGDLVLYLYNPFGAPLVARVVETLERAMASDPARRVFVVYYNPVAAHCFDASAALCRFSAEQIPYADDEQGYGPDPDDAVVVWQSRRHAVPARSADRSIVLQAGGVRATLAQDG
ncbi:MAG: hypothetical protein K0Q76_1178 [Panacagrimonas sp.]|jgi:SAM-dependent methyltransferase|nr:class I SAM-dependent methyltransferase [Panacagrimonas sp.]MCC2656070.1 hypothetical protein [Panacagrimonas sp.]